MRVPDRVVLVILPQGGPEDYQALFHEAGHTEHFAHTSRDLPAEHRLLGDNGVTEGYAFLLEHLVSDRRWLGSRLDFGPIEEYVRFSALTKLFFVRRYAAKLAYEIELHTGAALDTLPGRYSALLSQAVGVPYPTSDYLEDVDGGFYCTSYLRAWAFETQLREPPARSLRHAVAPDERCRQPGAGDVEPGPVDERRRSAAGGHRLTDRLRRAHRRGSTRRWPEPAPPAR